MTTRHLKVQLCNDANNNNRSVLVLELAHVKRQFCVVFKSNTFKQLKMEQPSVEVSALACDPMMACCV